MSTITLQNFRVGSDLTVKIRLKDGGVAIDWSTLSGIRAVLYSDAQSSIAGRCDVTVDGEDPTLLVCRYAATKMQYLGVNRIVVSAKYMGETKTYDKPAFTFVRWTADQEGEQITIEDPEVTVEISVEDVSSSILQEAVDAAFTAADRANDAAEAAEHMVDIHTGPEGKSAYEVAVEEGYTGTEEEWLASLKGPVGETPNISIGTVTTVEPGTPAAASMSGTPEAPVLNLSIPKGLVGATPNFTVGTVTTGEPGSSVIVTITGTPEAPVLNLTIPQGMQGNTGSSVEYPYELVNNLTTNDATKGLSAAQGVVLDGKVSQLEAKVDDLSTGKYYGYFATSADLPDDATVDGFAYVGSGPTYTIYNCEGGVWTSSGITVNQSPIGNDEDIDQNEDGKLQFANRVYNAQQPNGMGYKILRKDATFASQVTDTNTIYEIRYDFDLGGNDVEMPLGCVLRFNGGHLSNGTLVGSGTQLQDLYDGCLLCDFGGTFTNMTIKASSVGLVPQGNAINVQDSFVRLAKLISATEEIVVEFAPGIYGFGNGGKTLLIPGGARGYYNYPAIYVPANANNKKLKIEGNGATFIRIGTTYIGKFDFSGETPVIDTTTAQSYAHWSQGGGFLYYGQSGTLEVENCTIDGNKSNYSFGGYQTASQECSGIICKANFNGQRLKIQNFVTDALSIGSVDSLVALGCEFKNNLRWGVSTGRCERILFDGCLFEGNGKIYKINEYYRFEGNWGDIDMESASDGGEGDILIQNCKFFDTGGASCIVSVNGNIDSFVVSNCSFHNSHTVMDYETSSSANVVYREKYTLCVNIGPVKGNCEINNCFLSNYVLGHFSRGEVPLSTYVPEETESDPIIFYKDTAKRYSFVRNVECVFTKDCTGYLATGTTYPFEGFFYPSYCYNYSYNTATGKWTKIQTNTAPYDTYHFGECIFENLVFTLAPNVCVGSFSYNSYAEPLASEIHGMTINVYERSPKNYIKNFKATASVKLKLIGLIVNDFNQGEQTIFGEGIYKTLGDTPFVYRNYGNGNKAIKLEVTNGNKNFIPEATPATPICGITSNRPDGEFLVRGLVYFDIQLNKPIWWDGTRWVDATGTAVSALID